MKAIEFLKNKGITKATCYTDSSKTYYVNELAELMEEYAALRQQTVVGRSEQLVCDCKLPTSEFELNTGEKLCCKCEKPKAN